MPDPARLALDSGMLAAAPQGADAGLLHRAFQQDLVGSYAGLLASVGQALGLAEDAWRPLVPAVRDDAALSSDAYAVHWRLATAVADQDVSAVGTAVEALSGLETRRAPGLRVGTLRQTPTDDAAMAILRDAAPDWNEPLRAVDDATLDHLVPLVQRAVTRIRELDAPMAAELDEYVGELRLCTGALGGMTSVRFFGTVFLHVPDPAWDDDRQTADLVDGLVHETSHLRLHTLMAIDPLILNSDDELHRAPLRDDLRPLSGIYHATFILSRLARLLSRGVARTPADEAAVRHLEQVRERFWQGHETISAHGRLTLAGQTLLEGMRATAEADPLPVP